MLTKIHTNLKQKIQALIMTQLKNLNQWTLKKQKKKSIFLIMKRNKDGSRSSWFTEDWYIKLVQNIESLCRTISRMIEYSKELKRQKSWQAKCVHAGTDSLSHYRETHWRQPPAVFIPAPPTHTQMLFFTLPTPSPTCLAHSSTC